MCCILYNCNTVERFTTNKTMNVEDLPMNERRSAYKKLMDKFNTIFPDRNRNAGGPQWFKYIVDMNLTKHDFELVQQCYDKQSNPILKINLKDKYNKLRNNYNQEWTSII
jgi:hypothetical protein